MNTLLIDSRQIESDEAIDPAFRKAAEAEIEQFRREKAQRDGAAAVQAVSDEDLLREVMNTVGKEGRLGEQIRCVVSVSMLTEGWDTNTVTHILGVRAFGTQLLCEQVIGRALRRLSYETGESRDPDGNPLLNAEYADILGIPFDFASEAVRIQKTPPKPVTRVYAVRERASLAIRFPRVAGYRTELPGDRFDARFTADSKFVLDPALVGPSQARLEGVVGVGIDIAPDTLDEMRESTVALHLSKRLVERYFVEGNAMPPYHLVGKLQPITRRWLSECVQYKGGTKPGMFTYLNLADGAADLIYAAIARHAGERVASVVKAILDPFNPAGATDYVSFITTKDNLYRTRPDRCHVNIVVCDSDWEAEFARVAEGHPAVISYVKNQGLGFEVPLNKKTARDVQAEDKALEFSVPVRDGAGSRRYLPDFIVRVDDGCGVDDPLNLVVEIKGEKDAADRNKAETMRTQWVPGVNNLGSYGRWDFVEFSDVFAIEEAFAKMIEDFKTKAQRPRVNGDGGSNIQDESVPSARAAAGL
jgi:type III restriction enzyme